MANKNTRPTSKGADGKNINYENLQEDIEEDKDEQGNRHFLMRIFKKKKKFEIIDKNVLFQYDFLPFLSHCSVGV